MKFKIRQELDYAAGYIRDGHLEGTFEAESKEALEKIIKEEPEEVDNCLVFELDSYELEDYSTGDNPIIIEGEVNDG